eukprot:evm.model.scf_950.4 EVM.evm.TU.scf_950.4   scf_950:34104-35978(-)
MDVSENQRVCSHRHHRCISMHELPLCWSILIWRCLFTAPAVSYRRMTEIGPSPQIFLCTNTCRRKTIHLHGDCLVLRPAEINIDCKPCNVNGFEPLSCWPQCYHRFLTCSMNDTVSEFQVHVAASAASAAVDCHPISNVHQFHNVLLPCSSTLSEEEAKSSHTSLSTVPIDAHQFNTFVKNFVASVAPRARSESLEDWASATESPHGDSETTLAAVSTLIQGLLQQAMNMSLMPSLGYLSPGAPPEGSAPGGGGPAEEGAAAAEQRTASSVSSTNSNKPAVTERGKKVGERARWFLGSLSQLLKLELERGGLEYDRLEVANRMTAAEYQKMAEDLRRMKAHAQEFADEQTRLSEEADGCIAELEGLVSKLEIDVKDLEERTKQLSKRPH